ncbi:hypothetical protein GCM10007209_36620 [Haloferax sulfurifontis]|uniref:Uncharacterized protein n=1 Tax=Haloferax sulfurifontis TaxID=255616 RepID=A0A830EF14_9EURY|nr:hypothetical protein GCM10007209_36620 [Haloferax sulfurifontis]
MCEVDSVTLGVTIANFEIAYFGFSYYQQPVSTIASEIGTTGALELAKHLCCGSVWTLVETTCVTHVSTIPHDE